MEITRNIAAQAEAADLVLSSSEPNFQPAPAEEKKVETKTAPVPSDKKETNPQSIKLTKEEAKEAAADLEKALNKVGNTEIQFNVSLVVAGGADESKSKVTDFKFQVVEKKTGKIIRQFPPDDINGIKQRAQQNSPKAGLFLNSVA
jgi:uncharacterized FlaG/YvyC family protein